MKNNELLLFNASQEIGEKVVSFSSSDSTTWFVTESGALYGCGRNDYGQQGDGSTNHVRRFTKRADNVAKVKATNSTTWYITNSGDLYGCGLGSNGQQGSGNTSNVLKFTKRGSGVSDVVCSELTTWALIEKSSLGFLSKSWYGCGANSYGQQGSGDRKDVLTFTSRFSDKGGEVIVTDTNTIYTAPSSSFDKTYIYFAGRNAYGQFGNGTTEDVLSFTGIEDDTRGSFRGGSSGDTIFYLVYPNYPKRAGRNDFGQLGTGNTTNLATFQTCSTWMTDVFAFTQYTSFLGASNFDLYASGRNNYGQLGRGNSSNLNSFTKVASGVYNVWACNSTTWYRDSSGNIYGCGRNDCGQQGSGNTSNILKFTKRTSNIVDIQPSDLTTWYLTEDGNLYGCGDNSYGQQGESGGGFVSSFTKRN